MAEENKKNKDLLARPPVVVVLGHVDHGKSSLLETIKDLKIIEKESGGITQHIGAYEVEEKGKKITFIDTPGHEAFSAMRSRGAKLADIAILVIAADEGAKLQTKEAIAHIKGAKLPMIVAINKMDKPGADPEKIKRELAKQEVLVESMGGKVPCLETSAQTGKGISELLEMILLVAEMEDLKADISKPAEGVVIESYLDAQRGPTATLILQNGTLKKDDILGTSSTVGKIKIMEDFQGEPIDKALPSMPVIVLGFENVPRLGEEFKAFDNIEEAKKKIVPKEFPKELSSSKRKELSSLEGAKLLNLILKVDVLGSLEAIEQVLKDIPQEEVVINILKAGVGEINDSDVKLAKSSGAKLIGFRVKANQIAQKLALREKIKILSFEVIYELAQTVREFLERSLAPEEKRIDLGRVKVLAIFRTEKNRQIIGGKVIEGELKQGAKLEIYRNEQKVGSGKIIELQREKKKVGQVSKGQECGILYEGDVKIEEGDILWAYTEEKRKGELINVKRKT